jgi:anti-anti-sigma factor
VDEAAGMTIIVSTGGDTVDVELVGALDEAGVANVTMALHAAVEVGRCLVRVHLDKVNAIDRVGVEALLDAATRADRVEARLVLVAPPKRVLDFLLLHGVDHRFTIERGAPVLAGAR